MVGVESRHFRREEGVSVIEEDYLFNCPYCGEEMSARLDPSGGKKQDFVQDCEVCCKPIQIKVHFKGREVEFFSAEDGD